MPPKLSAVGARGKANSTDNIDTSDPQKLLSGIPIDNPLYMIISVLVKLVQDQSKSIDKLSKQLEDYHKNASSDLLNTATNLGVEQPSFEEIERRRSAVLCGLPESQADTPFERWQEDSNQVNSILNAAGVESGARIYRLGKFSIDQTRPRLIKLIFPASIHQRQAIQGQKNFRHDPQHTNIYIRPSLTPEQRKAEAELRKECRELNKDGAKFKIFKGKIVPISTDTTKGN